MIDGFHSRSFTTPDNITNLAVCVRSAYKYYERGNYVLKGLNLNVTENKIYSLLGPSGCGKTTLLHSIIGRTKLNSGKIILKYRTVADLGYMPQALALHKELSIKELFLYYGLMFHLEPSKIKERIKYLLNFLELPNDRRIVGTLSGGQQRRISFAVAILHDPRLLILDEPTVGLDPILCQSIWNLLRKMADNGKTIIITTHYIEEAKASDVVGIMRQGKLLAEKSPLDLLKAFNCEYLEDAFLQLCKQDGIISEDRKNSEDLSYVIQENSSKSQTIEYDNKFSYPKFKAQLLKNMWMIRRTLLITLFVLVLPLVQISSFNMATGADPIDLPIAFVNEEIPYSYCPNVSRNTYSNCFMTDMNETEQIPVYLSCNMLELFHKKKFKLIEYENFDEAQKAVVKNQAWALIHFHSNFTQYLSTRFYEGTDVQNNTIDMGNVDTFVDQSNHIISHFIKIKLLETYREVMEIAFRPCNSNPSIANLPIKLMDPVFGNKNPSFREYTGPSMLSQTAFYLPVLYTAAMLLFEKDGGLLERVMVSGMTFSEIAASHFVIQLSFIAVQNLACMILMYSPLFFNAPFEGSSITTYVLLFFISVVGMLVGFVIALVSKSQSHAAYFGIGCNFTMKFLCGMMWPTQGMDKSLQFFSSLLPITLATDALRSLGSRGWDYSHPEILIGFGSTIAWIPVLLLLAYWIMRRNKSWYDS